MPLQKKTIFGYFVLLFFNWILFCSLFLLSLYEFAWILHAYGFNLKVADYIKKHIPPPEQAEETATEEGTPPQDPLKITEEIFQHEDHDRDGYISFEEFSGPKHDEL